MNKINVNEYLTKDEIKQFLEKSNFKASLSVLHTWVWIAFAFFIAGMWTNPFTIISAMFILGGKQLGCAILMHDCAHRSMFITKEANIFFGNWFGAFPILHDVERYRPYHIEHHVKAGSDDDPDLSLTRGYPATVISFIRKIVRDLIGASGIKGHVAVLVMHWGYLKYELGGRIIKIKQNGGFFNSLKTFAVNMAGPVAANIVLYGILWLCGQPWLYLLWIGSLLTTYNFSLRIRSIAEHSVVPDRHNDYTNTRTTHANFFEKILFAPHHVNYHAEHHLLMTVPSYNFPAMHKLIKSRGYYEKGLLEKNYIQIFKLAIRR